MFLPTRLALLIPLIGITALAGCAESTTADLGQAQDGGIADIPSSDLSADDLGLPELGPDLGPEDAGDSDLGAPAIPVCDVDIEEMLSPARIDPPSSGSNAYTPPSAAARVALQDALLRWASSAPPASIIGAAQSAGYTACSVDQVTIFEPAQTGLGHPVILLREDAAQEVVLQAPHAWFEFGTRDEARILFEGLGARAALISGVHRCAADGAVACDGRSTVCEPDGAPAAAYRISDVAHNDQTLFHAAHTALADAFPTAWMISLHGMTGAGFSLSTGVSGPVEPASLLARFAGALQQEFPAERVSTCNDYPGADFETRLCGRTNVQGRYLNGADQVCTQSASTSSGRFLHLEQSRDVRGRPEEILAALRALFP